ncbi:MAG: hypothetical protein OEZ59_09245 [Deltaproteobacteria bacterium]|nr:hypothetical protein [Deltaproteobacteria bacterium]
MTDSPETSDAQRSLACELTTSRKDWDKLVTQIFAAVVAKVPFGLALVSREKTLLGAKIRYRINPTFPNAKIGDYIRSRLDEKTFGRIFSSNEGLESSGIRGVMKVVSDKLGLPKNSLICRLNNSNDSRFKAIVVFGGERFGGKLEQRMENLVELIKEGGGKFGARETENLKSNLESLDAIDASKLAEYKLSMLSHLVNSLEDTPQSLSSEQRQKLKTINGFVMRKQLRR